jgi:hypothetical protein
MTTPEPYDGVPVLRVVDRNDPQYRNNYDAFIKAEAAAYTEWVTAMEAYERGTLSTTPAASPPPRPDSPVPSENEIEETGEPHFIVALVFMTFSRCRGTGEAQRR